MSDEKPKSSGIVFMELLRASFWPGVALICLYQFATPIHDILVSLSRNIGSAQSIDFPGFKLTIRDTKILPPSKQVSEALAQLDKPLLVALLEHGTDSGYSICPQTRDSWEAERTQKYNRLEKLGLMRYENRQEEDQGPDCPGGRRVAWLSDLGKDAKSYFVQAVLSTIEVSKE